MKNEKGITLIALIITIIVMLILVGVTINVALNGGIFERAKDATTKTQVQADKEALLVSVVLAINSKDGLVDFELLDANLPDGFKGEEGEYTSAKGNKFTVSEDGTIEENTEEETVEWAYVETEDDGEVYKCLYYIGNKKELKLKPIVKSEVCSINNENIEGTEEYVNVDLENTSYIKISDSYSPQTEIIDFNGINIDLNNLYILLDDNASIKTLKGLDGLRELSEDTISLAGCTKLNTITLPNSLETLGYHAFTRCIELISIKIPDNVTTINSAFGGCTNLTDITIKQAEGSLNLYNSGLTAEQIASIKWEPEE